MIKKNTSNLFTYFLLAHIFLWTLAPSISNKNLPLDTIEHLAWASNLDWGFEKHPPLVAFVLNIFFKIFGNQDWSYYFLSQLFLIISFIAVWKLSSFFFKEKIYWVLSVFLLEGIYFYNFTTPEFNVNVCQIPFWALTVFYFWRGIEKNETKDWLLVGVFSGLGILTKYTFLYLIAALNLYLLYLIFNKRINLKFLISLLTFVVLITPHLIWLNENNFVTLEYAVKRSGFEEPNLVNHFKHPLILS